MGLFSRKKVAQPTVAPPSSGITFDVSSPTNAGAWFKYAEFVPPLEARQWCGLALTHVQSVAWDLPVNTLSTFSPQAEARAGLNNGWGITSADDARTELINLLALEADGYLGEIRDRSDTRQVLIEVGLLDDVSGQLPSIAAWDLSRVAMVTRMCVDADYLAENEAWDWVRMAADHAVLSYESLVEFGDAFVVGRVAWTVAAYEGEDAAQILPEARDFAAALVHLAQDADSPWLTVPWPPPDR